MLVSREASVETVNLLLLIRCVVVRVEVGLTDKLEITCKLSM